MGASVFDNMADKLTKFTEVVGELCIQHLGTNERKERKEVQKRPNRRQVQKGILREISRNSLKKPPMRRDQAYRNFLMIFTSRYL